MAGWARVRRARCRWVRPQPAQPPRYCCCCRTPMASSAFGRRCRRQRQAQRDMASAAKSEHLHLRAVNHVASHEQTLAAVREAAAVRAPIEPRAGDAHGSHCERRERQRTRRRPAPRPAPAALAGVRRGAPKGTLTTPIEAGLRVAAVAPRSSAASPQLSDCCLRGHGRWRAARTSPGRMRRFLAVRRRSDALSWGAAEPAAPGVARVATRCGVSAVALASEDSGRAASARLHAVARAAAATKAAHARSPQVRRAAD